MATGWTAGSGVNPEPPRNFQILSAYRRGVWDLRWDDPSQVGVNVGFTVLGVNIYRSFGSDRGPYYRINPFPVGGTFYRDFPDITPVEGEPVTDWVAQGTAPGARRWVFRTVYPATKRTSQEYANSPQDVQVLYRDAEGVETPLVVANVFGQTGEVTLVDEAQQNQLLESFDRLPLLQAGQAGQVIITYWRATNTTTTTALDRKPYYRVTTVAQDPETPDGMRETSLDFTPPVSPIEVETRDYIWREAIRRNQWILEQGGERVKVFIRRTNGQPCWCRLDERTRVYLDQPSSRCHTCFVPGTLVRTETGYREIEKIQVGDKVLSSDGNYHSVVKVLESHFDGNLSSILTSVTPRAILSTPEHPFLVLRGDHKKKTPCGPKCDVGIALGDGMDRSRGGVTLVPSGRWWARVQIRGSRGSGRKPLGTYATKEEAEAVVQKYLMDHRPPPGHALAWDDASHVKKGDWLVPQWNRETRDIDEIEIPLKHQKNTHLGLVRLGPAKFAVDEEFLWVVGMYLAEGSSGNRTLCFSLHQKEVEYRERLISFFRGCGYNPVTSFGPGLGCAVLIHSTTLANWFPSWLGRGCQNKHIPNEFMSLPRAKLQALLQGIYDGDGIKSYNEVTQTSDVLALQMIEILHKLGEQPLVRQMQSNALTPKGNTRKMAYPVSWAEKTVGRANRKGRWEFQDKVLSQVREVESVPYTGMVYNLEVEGDHTYVVQGIVVHNCYGVGIVGGFDGPFEAIIAPDDGERRVSQSLYGRRLEHTYEVWMGPSPIVTQRDFIVKQTGERYSIGAVRRPSNRGNVLQQHFQIGYIDEKDPRYHVPVDGTDLLTYPETRYTKNQDVPYPVGPEIRTPVITDKANIPSEREERGRTGTHENITY